MKQSISVSDFRDAFRDMGRGDQFSYAGLGALYEYLEQYEEDSGIEIELDVIALCCDFTEYEDLAEFQEVYPDVNGKDDLADNTTVIMIDSQAFIIQDY